MGEIIQKERKLVPVFLKSFTKPAPTGSVIELRPGSVSKVRPGSGSLSEARVGFGSVLRQGLGPNMYHG